MIISIIRSAIKNFQTYLVIWAVLIILNQLVIFGACFAPYCILAALPHTGIVALLVLHFLVEPDETH